MILPTKRLDQVFREKLMSASTRDHLQLFEFLQLIPLCQSIDPELEKERQLARKEKSSPQARGRNGSESSNRLGSERRKSLVMSSRDSLSEREKNEPQITEDMGDFDKILTTPLTRAQTRLDNEYDKRQFLFLGNCFWIIFVPCL